MKKERETNIELLRILIMIGVIILHYNNRYIGGGLKFVRLNSINYYVLMLLESVFICAVNLFMLISGYYSYSRDRTSLKKPLSLIIQVISISFGWTLIMGVLKGNLTLDKLLSSLVPANYFVVLYIAVYLLSPYLNLIFDKIDRNFIILIISIFSIYPTLVECLNMATGVEWSGLSSIGMYGSQSGYTIVNFIMLYYIGLYIRKREDSILNVKSCKLIVLLLVVITFITLWGSISDNLGLEKNLSRIYCNPLVIFEAVLVFILFKKIKVRYNKWINYLASAAFTVLLVHGYIINHIGIEWAVNQNVIIMLLHVLVSSISIYFLCFLVFLIYNRVSNSILNIIVKRDVTITRV